MGLREINEKRTREMIEAEARRLFCEQGIGETDLKQIADAVGIPRTTFYTYYRDKQDLATAVYLRNLRALMKHLEKPSLQKGWKACKGDIRTFLVWVTDRTMELLVKDPEVLIYDFAYNLQAAKQHENPIRLAGHGAEAAEGLAWYAERVGEAIREGRITGCENPADFQERMAFPLLGYLVRLAVLERQMERPDFIRAAGKARRFRDLLFQAIFPPT